MIVTRIVLRRVQESFYVWACPQTHKQVKLEGERGDFRTVEEAAAAAVRSGYNINWEECFYATRQ